MNISYRGAVASAAPETTLAAAALQLLSLVQEPRLQLLHQTGKVARLSCCCRLSELMPLVRQLHDEARALNPAPASAQAA